MYHINIIIQNLIWC